MPKLELNFPYHVVMSFSAERKSDGQNIRFLPGESVHLQTEEDGTVAFESANQVYECSYQTFRFGTMKLHRG